MKEEGEQKNLFAQFGLGERAAFRSTIMIRVPLQRDIELQEPVFKPDSTQVPASSCDQETQSY